MALMPAPEPGSRSRPGEPGLTQSGRSCLPPHHEQRLGRGPEDSHGPHLRVRRRGEALVAECAFDDHPVGAPGVVHGSAVATVFDDLSCPCPTCWAYLVGRPAVTRQLTVDCHRYSWGPHRPEGSDEAGGPRILRCCQPERRRRAHRGHVDGSADHSRCRTLRPVHRRVGAAPVAPAADDYRGTGGQTAVGREHGKCPRLAALVCAQAAGTSPASQRCGSHFSRGQPRHLEVGHSATGLWRHPPPERRLSHEHRAGSPDRR